jgi:hypothetical protein
MGILVPRWLDFSWQVRLQMCLKFCMVKIAHRTQAQMHSTIEHFSKIGSRGTNSITIPHCTRRADF